MLVLAVAELFASRLIRSIVIVSLSKHLLSSLVCWCSPFCHITAACVSGKIHYVIPVPLLFVERCKYQAMRQRHPQPIGGANSGWRRNARALRDDGKTKQNELAVRTLERRLVALGPKTDDLFMLLQMLDDCRHVRSLDCLPYWRPFSYFFLRTWNYELCIKASTPLPINSTLCLTIPGPAECAKRLNKLHFTPAPKKQLSV